MRLLCILLCLFHQSYSATLKSPSAKNLAIFTMIRFQNTQCNSGNDNIGTCYTKRECEKRSGVSDGLCADGYGVCCIFEIGCGGSSSENCTTFTSKNSKPGACNANICKKDASVVQLRLDFTTFVLLDSSVPETEKFVMGATDQDIIVPSTSIAGQCETNSFIVTSFDGVGRSPVLCGVNTGEHMYIDAADACTTLSFNINENSLVKPKWLISVKQYTSDFNNKAPKGCLQYFFGADKGIITGLNWKSMERNKRICIRKEANRSNMEYHQAGGTEIGEGNKVSCRAVPGTGTNPFDVHIVCGSQFLPNHDEADEDAKNTVISGFDYVQIEYVQT